MKWVCNVCGYVHEGPEAPVKCPQCGVPASKFSKQEGERTFTCSLCRDTKMPVLIFSLADPHNIVRAISGENVGTILKEDSNHE